VEQATKHKIKAIQLNAWKINFETMS
jgi:hypothetical protein